MVTEKARGSQLGLVGMVSAAGLGLGLAVLLLVCVRASAWPVFTMPPGLAVRVNSSGGHYSPSSAPAAVTLTRGPYLQSVTTDSIVVVWETNTPASSQVDYGSTISYGLVVSSVIPVTHHALTLAGLDPYSLYHYGVSSDGLALGVDSTFRSAAGPTQTTFSFVVFGDTAGTNVEAHQSVVNRAAALGPDFVLHNGDFVDDGRVAAQWTTFFSIEHGLLRQSPLYGTLGNDDMSSPNYFDAFHLPGNERWYSFDYGDAHIASLQMDDVADFGPGNAQFTWLDNDLANTDRQWKIVFFHIPPTRDALSTLVPILTKHGVDIVFSGHVHLYERTIFSGVVYVVSGGGGEPLYIGPLNPYSEYYTSTYHCVLVTINGRSLTSVGVRPDGLGFDPFTLYNTPVAAFESSGPGWLGQTILFTNTTLTSGATIYEWALGDGAESTEKNPTHAYMLPGLYTVTLTATNPAGSHRAVGTVAIYGAPAASFTAHPIMGPRPLTVFLTDETTTGPLADPTLIHLWQFGDGQTSTLRDPTHMYTAAQVYTVTLAVTNAAGSDMVARANYITVYVPLNVYLPLILSHSSGP